MRIAILLVLALAWSEQALADWNSCSSALQDLSSAADDAENYAQQAARAEREYEDQQERFDRCRRFPDAYDVYNDRCATLGRRARDAKGELDSAVDQLQNALSEVTSATDDVQSSCATNGGGGFAGICSAMQSLRGKHSDADLIAACKTRMPEALCKACLGLK